MAKLRNRTRLFLIQKQNGLNFQYDPLETPEGSYTVADNVWANREGLLESRRGCERFGAQAADRIDQIFEFSDRIHRHDDAGNLSYDSTGAGVFVTHAGTFLKPAADVRLRNWESRKQNFITTSLGVYTQDGLTQVPVRSGIEPFLELTITLAGTGSPAGPLVSNSQTGYRAIFGRENANGRILRGTPSEQVRAISERLSATYAEVALLVTVTTASNHGYAIGDSVYVENASDTALNGFQTVVGTPAANQWTFNVAAPAAPANGTLDCGRYLNASIEFPIPDDVVAGDFYEIYRTEPSASDSTLPGEEHYLVKQVVITAADIAAGVITYVDSIPVSLTDFGVPLYTNPTLGASSLPNDRPPYCVDLTEFKGHLHYGAAKWEQEREIILKDVTNIVSGVSWLEFGGERYTFAGAENIGLKQFQLFAPTTADNIRDTMLSLVRVINRASTVYYGFYVSGTEGAPGRVIVRKRQLNQTAFNIIANLAATGQSFEPEIPTAGNAVLSEEPGGDNVLARSKFEQPEAVPRLNTDPIGSERKRIERILKLRDVMVILKALDGFWVQTGNTDGTVGAKFDIKERDRSLFIYGRDTAAVLLNRVCCYSNQGFVALDEGGATIIGRQVEERLEAIRATASWDSLAFAFAYESEDMYVCFGPELTTDTECTKAWVWNGLNEKFVNGWEKRCSAGHVLRSDDKYYLAHADDDYVLQERKSLLYTGADYMDEGIAATITATSTIVNEDGFTVSLITVTYTYTGVSLTDGFRLEQGSYATKVAKVTSLGGTSYQLQLEELVGGYAVGACTLYIPIFVELRTAPIVGRNAALLKQFTEVHFEFENDRAFDHYAAFETDLAPGVIYQDFPFSTLPPNAGWGFSPWGPAAWGDPGDVAATPLIVPVKKDYARARRFYIWYRHRVAGEKVSLSQITVPLREISVRSSFKVQS